METFFPFSFGIRGVDVGALHHHNRDLWIGSADYDIGRGITRLDPITLQADHFDFDVTVNMNPTDISSILDWIRILPYQAYGCHAARAARRAGSEIVLLHQEGTEARRRQMLGRAGAIDAGADNGNVEFSAIQFR